MDLEVPDTHKVKHWSSGLLRIHEAFLENKNSNIFFILICICQSSSRYISYLTTQLYNLDWRSFGQQTVTLSWPKEELDAKFQGEFVQNLHIKTV